MSRSGYEEAYLFPDDAAAQEAVKTWLDAKRAGTKNPRALALGRIVETLTADCVTYEVRRQERVVRLEVTLHDDIDHGAEAAGTPTCSDFWDAFKAIAADLGGATFAEGDLEKEAGRATVARLQAEGRQAYLTLDVLRGITKLIDDPDQPGAWTASLQVERDLELEGLFEVRNQAGTAHYEGRLEKALLRLDPIEGAPAPAWDAGDVVVRVGERGAEAPAATESDQGPVVEPTLVERLKQFFFGD